MKIKKAICFFILLFILQINVTAQLIKENLAKDSVSKKDSISINVEVNYLRHYIWRAIAFGNDDVSQPIFAATYKNFTVNLSANINYIPKNVPKDLYDKQVAFDEQDIEISYANSFKKIDYTVKFDAYIYFHQPFSPSTSEAYLGLEYPVYKNVKVFTENIFDIKAYKGAYYNHTGMKWEMEKGKNSFLVQASVGIGNNKFNEVYFPSVVEVDELEEVPLTKGGISYGAIKGEYTHSFKSFYTRIAAEQNFYSKAVRTATTNRGTNNYSFTIGKDLIVRWKK
jgi:hypothetical protein